jgi:hypothetical protein
MAKQNKKPQTVAERNKLLDEQQQPTNGSSDFSDEELLKMFGDSKKKDQAVSKDSSKPSGDGYGKSESPSSPPIEGIELDRSFEQQQAGLDRPSERPGQQIITEQYGEGIEGLEKYAEARDIYAAKQIAERDEYILDQRRGRRVNSPIYQVPIDIDKEVAEIKDYLDGRDTGAFARGVASSIINNKLGSNFFRMTSWEQKEFLQKLQQDGSLNKLVMVNAVDSKGKVIDEAITLHEFRQKYPEEDLESGKVSYEPADKNWHQWMAEIGGSQLPAIFGSVVTGPFAPLTASAYQSASASGGSFRDAYQQLQQSVDEGLISEDQQLLRATESGRNAALGAAFEGLIGTTNVAGMLSKGGQGLKQLIKTSLVDASTDAVAAGISQYAQNLSNQGLGLDVKDFEGIPEEMGAEALFSVFMNLAGIPNAINQDNQAAFQKRVNESPELSEDQKNQILTEAGLDQEAEAEPQETEAPTPETEPEQVEAKQKVKVNVSPWSPYRPDVEQARDLRAQAEPQETEAPTPETEPEQVEAKQKVEVNVSPWSPYRPDVEQARDLIAQAEQEAAAGNQAQSEIPLGAPPSKSGSRIQPDPIYGKKPKKITKIFLDLRKITKSKITFNKGRVLRRRALGWFNKRTNQLNVKYAGDLDITSHELGHSLDNLFGLRPNTPVDKIRHIHNELLAFAEHGSNPPEGHPDPMDYIIGEGWAEWIRAFLVNPSKAKEKAPNTYAHFIATVPNNVVESVRAFGDDIRVFAGASGHDKTMANVNMSYDKQKGSFLEGLKPSTTDPDKFELDWSDRLAANYTNSMRAFEKSVSFLTEQQGIGKLDPSKNPIMLARLVFGFNEKLHNMTQKGLVDSKYNRVKDEVTKEAMSFEWLLRPFNNQDSTSIKDDIERMVSYMISQRTIELSKRFGTDILTGSGAGLYKDVNVANKTLQEFEALDTDRKRRIKEGARRYRVYADQMLQYMVDKGRMSKEVYQIIKENNIQYIALNRLNEVSPGEEIVAFSGKSSGKSIGSAKEIIKKINGSTKAIQDPIWSVVDTMAKGYKEADRNEAMMAFRELLVAERDAFQDAGPAPNLSQIGVRASSKDPNTVTIFVDGKAEHWQLQPDVYKAVKGITDFGYQVPRAFTIFARVLRWTVTNFPIFALRNRVRDFQNRLIISPNQALSGFDIHFNKDLKEQTTDAFQLFGGGQAGYYLMNENFYNNMLEKTIKELSNDKNTIIGSVQKIGQRGINAYSHMLSNSETATRLEEYRSAYKKAKKEGMDDYNASIYAAYEARDLLDFAVSGHHIKIINQVIPFTNAAIQGIRKTVRTAKDNPAGFAMRWALYAMIPALVNRMMIGMMGREDEYAELPAYRKDLFYNIPIHPTKGVWLSIPKPYELAVMAAGPERMISRLLGDEKAFEGYGGSVARSFFPFEESALAGPGKPFVEAITNFDFFRQKHIIPTHEEGKALPLRNTDRASRLGKVIQELFGVDARKADHVVKSTTSYYGSLALKLSDIGREEATNRFNFSDTGFFTQSPAYNSTSVQWVLKNVKKFGLNNTTEYREMQDLISDYFNSKTLEEQQQRSEVLVDYAKRLRKVWENAGIDEAKSEEEIEELIKKIKGPRKKRKLGL